MIILAFGSLVAPIWLMGSLRVIVMCVLHPASPCLAGPHPAMIPSVDGTRHSVNELLHYWLDYFLPRHCRQPRPAPMQNRRHHYDYAIKSRLLEYSHWWRPWGPRACSSIVSGNICMPALYGRTDGSFPRRVRHKKNKLQCKTQRRACVRCPTAC